MKIAGLKQMYSELSLDKKILKAIIEKNYKAIRRELVDYAKTRSLVPLKKRGAYSATKPHLDEIEDYLKPR